MKHISMLVVRLLMILLFAGWIVLWILKPTEFWTRKWKEAEKTASSTVFGYNGLDFVVYSFPLIALAIIGFVYTEFEQRRSMNWQGRSRFIGSRMSAPLLVNPYIGILSGLQILVAALFIAFLVWTFYVHVSNDFKKVTPKIIKSLELNPWQYKMSRLATRCGLLSEACLALLLLPVLRGMSLFRVIGIQFEASVRYHIWLGNALVFFATLHGTGTLLVWGMKHRIQNEMWKWQRKGRIYLAGEMALAMAIIMWITSIPQIRRKWFHLFYYTHHLYIGFIVLFLFHGGDRHFYMVFPGVFLFAIDKLLRVIQSRLETCILLARVFPCNAVELTLPKDPRMKYTPTSVVFLKIPCISKLQWHPFSVTSSSTINENTITVVVRCEGQWTGSLYTLIHEDHDSEGDQRKCVPVAIEGPYGPASLDFIRYDNLVLVAGGIGVTPFLSILKEIGSNSGHGNFGFPNRIQLIYTTKKSQDVSLLEPILPYLLDIKQFHIKLKVFVTSENFIGTTLRDVLGNILEPRVTTFSTVHTEYAAYGLERLLTMATIVAVTSLKFAMSLIFFNHFVIPPEKMKKYSSSWINLFLICPFIIAIVWSALIVIMIRWKRLAKEVQLSSDKEGKIVKQGSLDSSEDLNEHEISFGGRPNFQEILSNLEEEWKGCNEIGVLVCGPESMKESVASACKLSASTQRDVESTKRPCFTFHSLNFAL